MFAGRVTRNYTTNRSGSRHRRRLFCRYVYWWFSLRSNDVSCVRFPVHLSFRSWWTIVPILKASMTGQCALAITATTTTTSTTALQWPCADSCSLGCPVLFWFLRVREIFFYCELWIINKILGSHDLKYIFLIYAGCRLVTSTPLDDILMS